MTNQRLTDRVPQIAEAIPSSRCEVPDTDFTIWLAAPRERTARYFPVYSAVSRAMQSALRQWTTEWLHENPAVFDRKVTAYSLLIFSCTRPFRGRPAHLFTYDVQQTATLEHAVRTAGRTLREQLDELNSQQRASGFRGVMSLAPARIEDFVKRNRRLIYRMFSVETVLIDEVLKFTQINIPKLGLAKSVEELRSAFRKHLHRFTNEFDMADRTDELLSILTSVLNSENQGSALTVAL